MDNTINCDIYEVFNHFPVLSTERFVLRKIEYRDASALYSYFSDPEVTKYYDPNFNTLTEIAQAHDLIKALEQGYIKKEVLRWGITEKENDVLIGSIGFHTFNKGSYKAELGYELDRRFWGMGIINEVLTFLAAYGFNSLGLNRIEAYVNTENTASRKVLERVGFQQEGECKEYWFMDGKYRDVCIYSLLRKVFMNVMK